MAKTRRKAAKRTTADRAGSRARKSGVAKARKPGLRKPKPAKTDPRKQKPSLPPETTRLKRQLKAARMQLEASAEILRAVADASGDAAGPLQLIAETTAGLFKASSVSIQLAEGSEFTQEYRVGAIAKRVGSAYPRSTIKVGGRNLPGTVVAETRQIHIPDLDRLDPSMSDFPGLPHARAGGARTVCGTPLRREHKAIGALIVFRDRLLPFTGDELALLQSFADQAVIAIENARLFNETKQALERQVATADILRIISRSVAHAAPVFDTILESCQRLFNPYDAAVYLVEGDRVRGVARRGPGVGDWGADSMPLAGSSTGLAIAQRRPLHFPDLADKADLPEDKRDAVRLAGGMSVLYAPIISETRGVGSLVVTRQPKKPFTETEIEFIQSFADQAAIAIENGRLFNETKEALERQTATADILKVIASSPSNVQPVFEAIAERSNRLVGGLSSAVYAIVEDVMHLMAFTRTSPEADAAIQASFPRPLSEAPWADRIRNGEIVEIPDAQIEWADHPALLRMVRLRGFRCQLLVPLLRDGTTVGLISVTRKQPGAFAPHHVQLLQSFADQAVIAIENVRLFDEVQNKTRDLTESLQQQTATADVLKVISRSAFDLDSVMHTLARSAAELCAAGLCGLYIREGDFLVCRGYTAAISKEQEDFVRQARIPAFDPNFATTRVLSSGEIANIGDFGNDRSVATQVFREKLGFKSILIVPLMREGQGIGLFILGRDRVGQFSPRQVELVQGFADQAVIAIENARLFDEVQAKTRDLGEALEQQTATSAVLAVISRSPSDLNPVLEAISDTAARLCGSEQTMFFRYDGSVFRILASWNFPPEVHEMLERRPLMPGHPSAIGRAGASLKPVCIPDVLADPAYGLTGEQSRARYRATLAVPLLRDGQLVGALSLNRSEPGAFTEKQIELVTTFADQAVIAIENTRLFNETREALAYQTGSSNVLRVIASSPTDVEPVLKEIVESARELCEASDAVVLLKDAEHLRFSAHSGPIPVTLDKWPISRDWTAGRAFVDQKPVHVHDMLSGDGAEFPDARAMGQSTGATIHTVLSVPLLRGEESIGAILLRRTEVRPFNDKQINLLSTFADQAVIAIQNARLFRDTQEALERQTATAEILRVISQSPTEVQPVFDAIVQTAVRLTRCDLVFVFRCDGATFSPAAAAGAEGPLLDLGPSHLPIDPAANFPSRAIVGKKNVHLPDWSLIDLPEHERQMRALIGVNSALFLPLLRDAECIGVLGLAGKRANIFGESEIALAESFRDQAVIAIENVRLFNETREALERQTATADILKVIASSPDDVQPVFQAIAERSNHLVGGFATTVVSIIDDVVHLSAFTSTTPAADAALGAFYPRPLSGFTYSDAVRRGEIHRIVDAEVELAGQSDELTIVRRRGWRSAVWVPLLLEGEAIGVIGVTRVEPGPFADHHVDMLKTFADQAVIAISNVKLFRQVQERTRELSQSLDDLRTAQDRLVQTEKLASLGQLTAGIAHEIKNPLNFVNNFSALSVELIDEMTDIFDNPALDEAGRRKELDEIRELLKSNLEKVVQHGKRADSIVKNMLLHSREGSGEQRAVDINALLDESLNLAYHGARAEKPGFNITLQRDLDPDAGVLELFPQEITRALLNLISNGFYAASKREADNGEANFEPVLSAATKNLGNHIEIRIRDNGTGIPPEVKERMFNPFFTTKPAGEGTGLGLSMTHDIIVKQHGGRIEVDTQPGQFTEFTIVLPRAAILASTGKN